MANKTFRILSIDGGGLRGIIPVKILERLEAMTGKKVHEMFDLIAGTSTGGLITCAATIKGDDGKPKFSMTDIESIFAGKANTIFPYAYGLGRIITEAENMLRPKYSRDGLASVVSDFFGDKKITDCLTNIFVTSYDLTNNQGLFFKSRHALKDPGMDARLYDICLATSAAPTYFPSYEMKYVDADAPNDNPDRVCIDGGIYINNPAVGAFVEASKYCDVAPYNRPDLTHDDICVLSLGTGNYAKALTQDQGDHWGELQWAPNISDVMMQGVNRATSYQVDELTADGHYLRLQVEIGDPTYKDMSDASLKTREYLLDAVQKQVLDNDTEMKKLADFIKAADLSR